MNWFLLVFAAFYALGTLIGVAQMNKPPVKRSTPKQWAYMLPVRAAVIAALVWSAFR